MKNSVRVERCEEPQPTIKVSATTLREVLAHAGAAEEARPRQAPKRVPPQSGIVAAARPAPPKLRAQRKGSSSASSLAAPPFRRPSLRRVPSRPPPAPKEPTITEPIPTFVSVPTRQLSFPDMMAERQPESSTPPDVPIVVETLGEHASEPTPRSNAPCFRSFRGVIVDVATSRMTLIVCLLAVFAIVVLALAAASGPAPKAEAPSGSLKAFGALSRSVGARPTT